MITIVLPVSRDDFLAKVMTNLELLDCDTETTNILCIVDGDNELYIKVRNLINDTKFKQRLTVKASIGGVPNKIDVQTRRQRIAAIHNQAKELIAHNDGYVFLCEDDTTFPLNSLQVLLKVATNDSAIGFVEGVELGRWGTPYVGAWLADDVYDVKKLVSIENKPANAGVDKIDAGGLYCALAKVRSYKEHTFTSANGLGPDVNFGIELRQKGLQNYIAWQVQCKHYYIYKKEEAFISPEDKSQVATITHRHGAQWHVSS